MLTVVMERPSTGSRLVYEYDFVNKLEWYIQRSKDLLGPSWNFLEVYNNGKEITDLIRKNE